jgi:hypothetical protein
MFTVDSKERPLIMFTPMVHESKSPSNTNDVFYERVTAPSGESYRDVARGQILRDLERLQNLDLILERRLPGGKIMRRYVPAGSLAVSRKSTIWTVSTPRREDSLLTLEELTKAGFSRKNISIVPPTYDRKEINGLATRLMNAPFEKVIRVKK